MSGNTVVTTPNAPAPQPVAPAQAPAPAAVSMKGKYVIRLITLRYDAHRQALAQKIKAHMESNGFDHCIVRTSNGKLVVEVGPYDKYRQADADKAKVRKMKVGHERFDSAYVVQRSK
jgi:cell division protein FtsN